MASDKIVVFWRNYRERSTPLLWAESLECECEHIGRVTGVWCGHCQRWVCLYCTRHDTSDVELVCFVRDESLDAVDVAFDTEK